MESLSLGMIFFWLMRSGEGSGRFSAKGQKRMPVIGLEGVQYVYGSSKVQKVEVWLPEGKWEAVQYDLIAKTTHKLAADMQDHLSFTTPSSKAVMTELTNLKRYGDLKATHN